MTQGRAASDQINVILNSLAGAGVDVSVRENLSSVVWDVALGIYRHVVITGVDGKEVEMQKSLTHIQWRLVGSPTWNNVVSIAEITGPSGPNVVQTGTSTNINGMLKGNGTIISQATKGTDYPDPATTMNKNSNLSDLENKQTAINNLLNAGSAATGNVLTKDVSGNLIMKPAAGGGGGGLTYTFTLNEDIATGKLVNLRADGKIESIGSTKTPGAFPSVSPVIFNSGAVYPNNNAVFDPFNENRFIVCSTNGFFVGIINDNGSITMSGKLSLATSSYDCAIAFDPINRDYIYAVYNNSFSSVYVTYGILNTSNGVVSFAGLSPYSITAKVPEFLCIDVDPFNNGHIVIAYRDQSNGYGMYCELYFKAATNGWSNIGLTAFNSANTKYIFCEFEKYVSGIYFISYVDVNAAAARIRSTYPGGALGSYVNIQNGGVSYCDVSFNPNVQGELLAIYNYAGGTVLRPVHISLVGSTTLGTASSYSLIPWTPGNFVFYQICFDSTNSGNFVVLYKNATTNMLTIQEGSTDGTTVTLGTAYSIGGVGDEYTAMVANPNVPGQLVVAYDTLSNHYPNICLCQRNSSNLNKKTLVGVITEAGNATQSKAVSLLGGVISDFSGLTVNADYYAQTDGTISTTETFGSVYIGRAISATAIQTKKP